MTEPDCHFHHENFLPNQVCSDCGHKEKSLEEIKQGLSKIFVVVDPLYEKPVSAHRTQSGASSKCGDLDESEERNLKHCYHHWIAEFEIED